MKFVEFVFSFSETQTDLREGLKVYFDLEWGETAKPRAQTVYISDRPLRINPQPTPKTTQGWRLATLTKVTPYKVTFSKGFNYDVSFKREKLSLFDLDPQPGDRIAYVTGRNAGVTKVQIYRYSLRSKVNLTQYYVKLSEAFGSSSNGARAFAELSLAPMLWRFLAQSAVDHKDFDLLVKHLRCLTKFMELGRFQTQVLHPIIVETSETGFINSFVQFLHSDQQFFEGNVIVYNVGNN